MAGIGSSTTPSSNKQYQGTDGKGSTFDRNMQSYLKNRGNFIEKTPDEAKNTKYKYFQKIGLRRPEAIARNSVALNNDWNNTAFSAIYQDKSFTDLMYSQASEEKPGRLRDYRMIAAYSEVADAMDEICDETINVDENGEIVTLEIRNTDLESEKKEEIEKEFSRFVAMMELEDNGWNYFRQFLIEGELFFELILKDDYIKQGVVAIKNLPAEQFDPVYDNIQTMLVKAFIYKKPIFSSVDNKKVERYEYIPFEQNQVLYVNSGQYNETKDFIIPFIENCRRAYRQLSMIEDSVVIHRMVHAPLRFLFNVDVGRLPVPAAEAYLRKLQSQYWSTKTFDMDQGDIVKKYAPQSTLDSFWFAKRQGQEATTVETFGGQMSDGNMEPLDWFIKKLYRSLKTPTSRLNNETGYNDGTEMLREELKFAKMIIRQQQRFAQGIKRAFITHLKFKDMFDDWDLFDDNIRVEFNVPTNFYDMRESQKLNLKIETFNNITGNEMVSTIYAMKKYLDWRDSDILANLHFKKVEAEHMFEIEQIKTLGPNYKELLAQQAGGEAGGDMGAMGGSSGGGGMPPDFGGSGAAITDSEAPNVEAPLDQAETPEAPSNEPEMGV
jgi:hypothetical protein